VAEGRKNSDRLWAIGERACDRLGAIAATVTVREDLAAVGAFGGGIFPRGVILLSGPAGVPARVPPGLGLALN